jgi:crotonobetainyl-CoA:carnitine CoA-transferase CaiB-like acyl-CoA transferase
MGSESSPVLAGIRVLDLGRHIAAPFCAQMLGDMGAEVIKVESLHGDDTRGEEPRFDGSSLYFMNYNRNKKSIAVDLRSEPGKEVLTRLIERSDVLIQNFRPGVMEAMGFPYSRMATLNPRLIYLSISGFGAKGPYADRAAFDEVLQAMSGLMELTGQADGMPTLVGQPIVDTLTAVFAFSAVLLALFQRNTTDKGQEITVNLFGSALQAVNPSISYFLATGIADKRAGNGNRYEAGINTYRTRNGYVHLVAYADSHWAALATRIAGSHLASDSRYATVELRAQHKGVIDDLIQEWMGKYTTQEILEMMVEDGIPCGSVRSIPDVATDPELRQADRLVDIRNSNGNTVPMFKLPIDLTAAPSAVRLPPPLLGEHTMEVATELLGYPRSVVETWCSEGKLFSASKSQTVPAAAPPQSQ